MEVKLIVCTPCYKTKHKHVPAVKRHVIKVAGSKEEHLIDVCAMHNKRLDILIGTDVSDPNGNMCPKQGCGRGFTTRRGLNRHLTSSKHGKPIKEGEE